MSDELWVEGVIVEFLDGKPCNRAIARAVGKSEVVLADITNGAISKLSKKDLEAIHQSGRLKFLAESRDLGELKFFDLSEKEQRESNRKYQYIKKIQEKGVEKVTEKTVKEILREVAQEMGEDPPHWQSVRGWYKSFVASGRKMRGLYPKHRFKGSRKPKIDSRVLAIIRREEKRYYKLSQPTMASIFRNVEDKVTSHNLDHPNDPLQAPSYLTVQRRVLEGLYQTKQKSRKGSRVLQAELANAQSGIESSRVLERIEIDHTLLDIQVLHDDHLTLLGRPNITVLIDHFSHMVLGFQLSFENPSFASVCMACINAFLPKKTFMEELGCESSWPAHGIPATLVTDNGNEFWGKNFISVSDEIGSVFQYCPIKRGNYKSRVERFFGIVNSMVLDDLPGVVRKPGESGEGYDARQEAKMTFSEFKRYFVTWMTEVYHNLPIEATGMTPNEAWQRSEDELPIPFEDESDLIPILMATDTRQLSKGGIQIFVMDYNSEILKDLYRRDGPGTVTIKYNPFDIGYILVLDKISKIYIRVECTNYSYASGLSYFEHDKIRASAKLAAGSALNSIDLQRARVKLSKERDELHARNARRKSQVTTSNAARSEKIGVTDIKLIVDNSSRSIKVDLETPEDDLDLDGWSVD